MVGGWVGGWGQAHICPLPACLPASQPASQLQPSRPACKRLAPTPLTQLPYPPVAAADCLWSTKRDDFVVPAFVGMSVVNLFDNRDPTKPRSVQSVAVSPCPGCLKAAALLCLYQD